jgi:predicted nucleotidyltransferase
VERGNKIPEEGRNLSQTSKRSAKYRNPKGAAKYFEPYKNMDYIVGEDINPDDVNVPIANLRDELNDELWTPENELKPEVRQALIDIANSYFKSIELGELKVKDVYFTGSLANYGWTESSDIDLHIIVDYGELKDIGFLEDYLYLKKKNWLDKHDIKIFGFEVEPFAKDEEAKHDYKAIYSVLNNKWVVEPRKDKPSIDLETVREKSASIMDDVDRILDIKDESELSKEAEKLQEKLGGLRNVGLTKEGEYSNENLIYKTLRKAGYLDKLSDAANSSIDSQLSLNEKVKKSAPKRMNESKLVNLGVTPMVHKLKVQKDIPGMEPSKVDTIKDFISFVCGKLKMEEPVTVCLKKGRDEYIQTTASYVPSSNENHIRCGGRALVDILRSIAHELVHNRQRELNMFSLGEEVQNIGGHIEDQANSVAGVFIKDFTHNYGYDNIYDF